jgi:hypothetical protein
VFHLAQRVFQTASRSTSALSDASSSNQISGTTRAAIIGVCASAGGALLLGILLYCFCKKRKASQSEGPSPLIGSLDDDGKSFVDYSENYPAAVNHFDGRPLSFLHNVDATLNSSQQSSHHQQQTMSEVGFRSVQQPISQVGMSSTRMTQDDPFKFGFGKGSHTLTAALAGDLATARGQDLQREMETLREEERPHPYSEASFSRQKSVKFYSPTEEQPHPFASRQHQAQRDSRFDDPSDVDGPQGQQKWW